MKKFVMLTATIVTLFVLARAIDTPEAPPSLNIGEYQIGEHTLFIPKEYLKFRHTSVGPEAALLQAWYPGAAPVPGDDSSELRKQGVWWKNVRILISLRRDPTISFEKGTEGSVRYLRATELVAKEYGLEHYTQKKNDNTDLYDLWLEKDDGSIVSRITCTEKLAERSKPNCTHYFFREYISVKVHFDRRLLPDWLEISDNVKRMLQSFQSRESAKQFFDCQITGMSAESIK